MNQEKIGRFIAELRKSKKLTQVQLAEKIGVTDKSISKWENGKCMPDLSLFPILCEELDITINELLSGEKLDKKDYQKKFEENIILNMDILKKKTNKIINMILILIVYIFTILVLLIFIFLINQKIGYKKIYLSDNELEINVCKQKQNITVFINTTDNSSFYLESSHDETLKEFDMKAYKYKNINNMKGVASSSISTFKNDIEIINFNGKTIYKYNDKLEDCVFD